MDQFGLLFSRADDQLFLSTAFAGQFFSNCDVCDLAGRLERVLVGDGRRPHTAALVDGSAGWGEQSSDADAMNRVFAMERLTEPE